MSLIPLSGPALTLGTPARHDFPAQRVAQGRQDVNRLMRGALAHFDAMLPVEAENVDGLAAALQLVQQLKRDLSAVQRQIEEYLVKSMPRRVMPIEGIGVLTRYGGSKRVWDHAAVLSGVVRSVLVNEETGEVDGSVDALRRLVEVIARAAGVTDSSQWRTGVLRDLGLDPDDLSEKVEARKTVSLTGGAK